MCDAAISACLWETTSSSTPEQGRGLSGPPEIETICLSQREHQCAKALLCWHYLLSHLLLRRPPDCLWLPSVCLLRCHGNVYPPWAAGCDEHTDQKVQTSIFGLKLIEVNHFDMISSNFEF